jgi:hypothetical protein
VTREEPGTLTQGAPVFPGSSRLGTEPKTPGWLVQDPTTGPIGNLIPTIGGSGAHPWRGTGVDYNHDNTEKETHTLGTRSLRIPRTAFSALARGRGHGRAAAEPRYWFDQFRRCLTGTTRASWRCRWHQSHECTTGNQGNNTHSLVRHTTPLRPEESAAPQTHINSLTPLPHQPPTLLHVHSGVSSWSRRRPAIRTQSLW